MKKISLIALAIGALLLVWYLVADRVTPFTGNARVKALVVPIVPQVSGYVSAVAIANNSLVEAGQTLAQIDQRPFQFAVTRSQAELQQATQEVGAGASGIETAQARLTQARTNLENIKLQGERIFKLEKKGLVPIAKADDARAKLAAAQSEVSAAKSELERVQQELGAEGGDNPRIRSAVASLGAAELNLEWTTLKAPSRGAVVDLRVDEGTFAQAGQPLMTFISGDDVWVEAFLTENNLGLVSIGDPVKLTLDVHPGRVIDGVVASLGAAASAGRSVRPGDLPTVQNSAGWMRDPQRFPVVIHVPGYRKGDESDDIVFRLNGQADIIVFTKSAGPMRLLGMIYIRLVSLFSYAY